MQKQFLRILTFSAAALLLSGCGPGRGDVSGVVYFKNKPLEAGTITFYDEYKGVASSEIKTDGSYAVTNVATGTAKMAVVTLMNIQMPGMPALKTISIPPKYNHPEKSGLTCNITRGKQEHKIDLD